MTLKCLHNNSGVNSKGNGDFTFSFFYGDCGGGYLIHFPFLSLMGFLPSQSVPSWITNIPVAHRGLHQLPLIPENSLLAFQQARDKGFAIELDVHLTQDHQVVVFHDTDLKRLTGYDGTLQTSTYADIKRLWLLGTSQKIPLFSEVLELISGKVPIYVEIKNKMKVVGPLEQAVLRLIQNYHGPIAVISFNPRSLEWFRQNAPHILRGQTSCSYSNDQSLHSKLLFRHYLYNWLSRPDFLVHELEDVPKNRVLRLLRPFKTLLTYGAKDKGTLAHALAVGDNLMFDHVEKDLSSLIQEIGTRF